MRKTKRCIVEPLMKDIGTLVITCKTADVIITGTKQIWLEL